MLKTHISWFFQMDKSFVQAHLSDFLQLGGKKIKFSFSQPGEYDKKIVSSLFLCVLL